MRWRVLPLMTTDAFTAMGIDEAISQFVSSGKSLPTIRFWRWDPSAVSIGYFQSLLDEINVEKCKESGFDVVRRITGGGAVFHDFNGEITYSVIAPESFDLISRDITKSYHVICGWIIDGLKRLGIETEFKPINDIIVNGKKISGNAQTRRYGTVLQHGTILYDLDVKKMFSVLKVGQEKISDKMIASVEERVTCLRKFGEFKMEEVYQALVEGFTNGKDFEVGELSQDELQKAEELADQKYKSYEWNYRR